MTMKSILQSLDFQDEMESYNQDYMDEFYHPYNLEFSDFDIKESELEEKKEIEKEQKNKNSIVDEFNIYYRRAREIY